MDLKRDESETLAKIGWFQSQPNIQPDYGKAAASSLAMTLTLSSAKVTGLVIDPTTPEQWAPIQILDDQALKNYLVFGRPYPRIPSPLASAWGYANHFSMMSSRMELIRIAALVWALGAEHDELYGKVMAEFGEFTYYGKRALVAVCEAFQVNWQAWDSDDWRLIPKDEEPKTARQVLDETK